MIETRKKFYYLTPLLLAIFIFASNFLNTGLFNFGDLNFAVWFVLSLFCFACGWLINNTLGWRFGGRIVFAVIVATIVLSIILISILTVYFNSNELLTENLILYSLRNVTLGCMGFFGMTVSELLILQREIGTQKFRIESYENMVSDAKKQADLELKDAKIKAERIIMDAENQAKSYIEKKERLEREINEFIQTERELLKKYEQEG